MTFSDPNLSRKAGWEYLCCLCENPTQADTIIVRRRQEGWLVKYLDVTKKDYIEVVFNRMLFHPPGWYVVMRVGGVHDDEVGPYNTEDSARNACNPDYILSVKYYDIDRAWELGDRFMNIAGRQV